MSEPSNGEPAWRRVHPATPVVRSWLIIAAALFYLAKGPVERWGREEDPGVDRAGWVLGIAPPWVLVALAGGFVLLAVLFHFSWRATTFRVGPDRVETRTGIVLRQHRQAPLDRIQAVDLERPLLARLLGLSELRINVADGEESSVKLAFLRAAEAESLRRELIRAAQAARASAPHPDPSPSPAVHDGGDIQAHAPAPLEEAPPREVLQIRTGRLVASILLHEQFLVPLVLLAVYGVWWLAAPDAARSVAGGAVPLGLAFAGFVYRRVSTEHGFRLSLAESGEGARSFQFSFGLFDTTTQTVPHGRVQAVKVSQPFLWRLRGWWKVELNVAGYGVGDQKKGRATVAPVADAGEVSAVLELLLPGERELPELLVAALHGDRRMDRIGGGAAAFTPVSSRARFFNPFEHRRNAHCCGTTALWLRRGFLSRTALVVPWPKVQGVKLSEGPLARAAGTVRFQVRTTQGVVVPELPNMDRDAALELWRTTQARALRAGGGAGTRTGSTQGNTEGETHG